MKYLDLAAKIALGKSDNKHFLLGAVAERNDGAIVISTNVRTPDANHGAHAETRILKKAGAGATIWLARIDRKGQWAMSRPCHRCQILLKNKRVRRVYYTISPGEYGVLEP